jgi:transposase
MERKLSAQERAQLIMQHRKERDKKVCDRIKAVLAYDDGYAYSEIAKILLLDDETIRRHIHDYFSNYKLAPENGGSQSYLNEAQAAELIRHLEESTYLHVKDISAYVKETYKRSYSISGMTKWLHEQGFCYKKPHGVPAKADKEKQTVFIEKYTELKGALKPDEVIVFGDNVHPQHQTKLTYGWIKKGVRKAEKMTACQKRVNIIGAINLTTHQVEYQKVDWVNKESMQAFAEQLCKAYPNAPTIHWILDNAGYHKGKEFLEFIKTTKIKIHYLPPYSPNLNPIERLWKIMHENTTYNHYYEKFSEFTEGIIHFFENIGRYKSIIQNRITDNFQKLHPA